MKDLDLFGKRKKKRRTRLEILLNKYDRESFEDRLERFKYIYKVFPKGLALITSLETAYVFDEAKMAFMNGEFVATLVLANAFIEHTLGLLVASKGYVKVTKKGLDAIVRCAREHKLVSEFILDSVDEMRKFRNPFIHIKELDDKNRLSRKVIALQKNPMAILQDEARNALSVMYTVAEKA